MINSHKEFTREVETFCEKMDFINAYKYNDDISNIQQDIHNIERRGLVLAFNGVNFEDDYNMTLSYGFTLIETVDVGADNVITAESENMFCISALDDYLNHVLQVPIEFGNLDGLNGGGGNNGTNVSLSGTIEFTVKRSASYWKKLDEFV